MLESSPRNPKRRIDDWATLRASRLTERLLAARRRFRHRRRHLSLALRRIQSRRKRPRFVVQAPTRRRDDITADTLSRFLLAMAAPGTPFYRPDFASLLGSVSIAPDNAITMHFRRVHVRPESMLQVPPPGAANQAGDYSVAAYSPDQVVFAFRNAGARNGRPASDRRTNHDAATKPPSRHFKSAKSMCSTAFRHGKSPVFSRFKTSTSQATSCLPSTSLIPNLKRPLLAKREFRRALCFGIDRKWIVDRILLGGGAMQGFQAISGPFPAGASLNDPIRYGYNDQIPPRPFEPRLAAILATVAWNNVQNPTGKDKDKANVHRSSRVDSRASQRSDRPRRLPNDSIATRPRRTFPIKLARIHRRRIGRRQSGIRSALRRDHRRRTGHRRPHTHRPHRPGRRRSKPVPRRRTPRPGCRHKLERRSLPPRQNCTKSPITSCPSFRSGKPSTTSPTAARSTASTSRPIALYQNIGQWTLAPTANVARNDPAQP